LVDSKDAPDDKAVYAAEATMLKKIGRIVRSFRNVVVGQSFDGTPGAMSRRLRDIARARTVNKPCPRTDRSMGAGQSFQFLHRRFRRIDRFVVRRVLGVDPIELVAVDVHAVRAFPWMNSSSR